MSGTIAPSALPSLWPVLGSHVHLLRYAEGNTLRGDHKDVDLDITGVVTETPYDGSNYLTITPDPDQSLPEKALYDDSNREAWMVSDHHVALRRTEFWQWTCEVLARPEPLVIEVGDRVTYAPRMPAQGQHAMWVTRAALIYTVVSLYEATNRTDAVADCVQVIPARNRHNATAPDEFSAAVGNLRLVAKAVYRDIS